MTPAAELLAAATKLRETHAALAACNDIRGPIDLGDWADWFGPEDMVHLPEVSAWIRLASPALALPLAAWLATAARDSEEIGTDHKALAVARVINGGAL